MQISVLSQTSKDEYTCIRLGVEVENEESQDLGEREELGSFSEQW